MTTYKVSRFYFRDEWPTETIATGLTLEQAQDHCADPETSSSTANDVEARAHTAARGPWFDGYDREGA